MPESAALTGQYEMYNNLVWLLVIVITVLALLLCYLHLAMRRSLEREHLSLDFSILAVEVLEAERRRVSRELHDTVLPLIRESAVSDTIRSICIDLMPPDFTRLSLKDCLADLCAQFSRRAGIECACLIEEGIDFSSVGAEIRLHLYRIVQEAFTNIEKHSHAGKAALAVCSLPQGIMICVSDNGQGLQSKQGMRGIPGIPEGIGMRSIRQRAVIAGAKLDFISGNGNGLMVRLEIPQDVFVTGETKSG